VVGKDGNRSITCELVVVKAPPRISTGPEVIGEIVERCPRFIRAALEGTRNEAVNLEHPRADELFVSDVSDQGMPKSIPVVVRALAYCQLQSASLLENRSYAMFAYSRCGSQHGEMKTPSDDRGPHENRSLGTIQATHTLQ
jgi:hypothetical protein